MGCGGSKEKKEEDGQPKEEDKKGKDQDAKGADGQYYSLFIFQY